IFKADRVWRDVIASEHSCEPVGRKWLAAPSVLGPRMAFQRDQGGGKLSRLDLLRFPCVKRITYIGKQADALCLIGVYRLGGNSPGPFRPVATGGIGNRQQRAPVIGSTIVEVRRNSRIGTAQPTDIVTGPAGTHTGELVEFRRMVVAEIFDHLIGPLAF